MKGYDMSEHWRLVGIDGCERITGTFWVTRPESDNDTIWVKAVDVTVWSEGRHHGRVLYSGDLAASVKNGAVDLRRRLIRDDKLDDVEEVWDDMLAAIAAVAAEVQP